MPGFEKFMNAQGVGVQAQAVSATGNTEDNESKAKKSELLKLGEQALAEELANDPSLLAKIGSLSNSIAIVRSYAFGDAGNIRPEYDEVTDPVTGKVKKVRTGTVTASVIIGYRIKNIGTVPITFNKTFYKDAGNGIYVAERREVTLHPGEEIDVTRKDLSILGLKPEFSLRFSEGQLVFSSKFRNVDINDFDETISSFYFKFDDLKKSVDDIKVQIGEKIGDKWVVKPEYVETFGFLNNPKEKKERARREASASNKVDQKAKVAAYLRLLAQKYGIQ